MSSLLEVRNLTVELSTRDGVVRALDDVSYDVNPGEIVGVVGESGAGKSINALALLGLLPEPQARVVAGDVHLDGRDLIALSRRELRRLRGKEVSIVFQDPLSSLNPVFTIMRQLLDAVTSHDIVGRSAARAKALDLLSAVGIPNAGERADQYPHQWSAGMRQRAMIAMAIANEPKLLVADEPTSALDATVQAQIVDLLRELRDRTGMAIMFISHDLGRVAELAERVMVMYAGRVVEMGRAAETFTSPRHPYTAGLIRSLPKPGRPPRPIPGQPPSLLERFDGCPFESRCGVAQGDPRCRSESPELVEVAFGGLVACHRSGLIARPRSTPIALAPWDASEPREALLRATGLVQEFYVAGSAMLTRGKTMRAVDDVSIELRAGEVLGLVGESGCGKSTLARLVTGLLRPTAGRVWFDGSDVHRLDHRARRMLRRRMQIVFQDPAGSLNPRMTVEQLLVEPLHIHRIGDRIRRRERVLELLDMVGLAKAHAGRYPHELSGGQRQRVAIGRALALDTEVLVLDEPVSALDVSVQAQIIGLLQQLQRELGLAMLFISHDLGVVQAISQRVAVMYLGRIIEIGRGNDVYERPGHPYTAALLSAVATVETEGRRDKIVLSGDVEGERPTGCRFRARCWRATEECAEVEPELRAGTGPEHQYACYHPLPEA